MEHLEREAKGHWHSREVAPLAEWEAAIDGLLKQLAVFDLIAAAKNTLLLTAISMPLAVCAGLFLALCRMSNKRLLSWPAIAYIETIRGTPLLVQMYLIFYSLPQFGNAMGTEALNWPPFAVGVLCLAGNYAAYESEIHRAGLQAVDRGQREAALSIGMTERQAFFLVTLPQAFRIVVPPIINDLIAMLKDSSLASAITVQELMYRADFISRSRSNTAEMYVVAALIYLVMSLVCGALGKYVERRLKAPGMPELHLDVAHGH